MSTVQAPKSTPQTVDSEVSDLVQRARVAQKMIEHYTQTHVDELVTSVSWHVIKVAEDLAQLTVDEGGFGNYEHKVAKIRNRVTGTLADLQQVPTVGVVEEIPEKGIVKIAKPVGVVAALIPTTGPDATPPVKTLSALKARNAIIIAPHPRTRKSSHYVVECMRKGCERVGAPADLVQVIEQPSITKTQELMQQADLVVATGGADMVKAAYASGTPAYGVGVGNAAHVVDDTADLDDAAAMIAKAKTFDYATSCLADNAVVAHVDIYEALKAKLIAEGGYVCSVEEKSKLQKAMWPDGGHIPTIDVVAKPVSRIAKLAGLDLSQDCSFLIVEEDGIGPEYPFSGEKLCVVLALYKYDGDIENAVGLVNKITGYQGLGHTCGIHTRNDKHVEILASGTKTGRVLVNQNLNEGAGSPRNGMPYTLSLSCGTWGGNITTENVNVRHFLNLTWVSRPIPSKEIREEQLFHEHWQKYGKE